MMKDDTNDKANAGSALFVAFCALGLFFTGCDVAADFRKFVKQTTANQDAVAADTRRIADAVERVAQCPTVRRK